MTSASYPDTSETVLTDDPVIDIQTTFPTASTELTRTSATPETMMSSATSSNDTLSITTIDPVFVQIDSVIVSIQTPSIPKTTSREEEISNRNESTFLITQYSVKSNDLDNMNSLNVDPTPPALPTFFFLNVSEMLLNGTTTLTPLNSTVQGLSEADKERPLFWTNRERSLNSSGFDFDQASLLSLVVGETSKSNVTREEIEKTSSTGLRKAYLEGLNRKRRSTGWLPKLKSKNVIKSFNELLAFPEPELETESYTSSVETVAHVNNSAVGMKLPSDSIGILERKCLLKAVSGTFRHGELVAIMGPSGAGKSTLMNVLTGYKVKGASGEVMINGQKRNLAVFRRISAYIMQSDHVLENLTVKEAMTSAANLKLSNKISSKQKKRIVDEILTTLGLSQCKHTRGGRLSGGQRKRLSIAQELINNPPVMFFDEPTSGLDAQTCLQCISILKSLSTGGRTVVCTIHQPSARVFEMFDTLYMLADGRCIYRGKTDHLLQYLNSFGLKCPPYHNPADFVIEVASGVYGDQLEKLTKAVDDGSCERSDEVGNDGTRTESQNLTDPQFEKCTSSNCVPVKPSPSCREQRQMDMPRIKRYSSNCAKQFVVLYKRTFMCILRDTNLTQLRFIIHLTVGVLIGLLYYDIGNKSSKVMNNAACMFFSVMFLMFTAMMPTVMTFPLEMDVLMREHLNYWYSLKSYFCAKSMADFPFQVIFPIIYSTIVYWMTGQAQETFRFVMFLAMCILVSFAAQSCGLLIGAATSVQVETLYCRECYVYTN
ncbi:unnamed protein product [Soboliphyme baturini]|uniref:ABC transporter domain-containing protein n=1 Tax=Soboliphyme baturini TaxID=241478 RepID=A0A183IK88_9BILA|nr:unnamed protein product [Soboliphyme baturini]